MVVLLCWISCSNLSEASYHSPFLPLPADCWSTCNPHGNALSSSPPMNSAAVPRSGARGEAISSKEVPEQLGMTSNFFQLSCYSTVTTFISHSVNPSYHSQEKTKDKPTRLGSSTWNKPAQGKNKILFKEICLVLGQKHSSFCLFLFTATYHWIWKREYKGSQCCQYCLTAQ